MRFNYSTLLQRYGTEESLLEAEKQAKLIIQGYKDSKELSLVRNAECIMAQILQQLGRYEEAVRIYDRIIPLINDALGKYSDQAQ